MSKSKTAEEYANEYHLEIARMALFQNKAGDFRGQHDLLVETISKAIADTRREVVGECASICLNFRPPNTFDMVEPVAEKCYHAILTLITKG